MTYTVSASSAHHQKTNLPRLKALGSMLAILIVYGVTLYVMKPAVSAADVIDQDTRAPATEFRIRESRAMPSGNILMASAQTAKKNSREQRLSDDRVRHAEYKTISDFHGHTAQDLLQLGSIPVHMEPEPDGQRILYRNECARCRAPPSMA